MYRILLLPILFASFVLAQPPPASPPPPPPPPYVSVNFNPMVAMLITLTISALFFIIFFSIYIIDCTSSPSESDVHVVRSRPLPKGLDSQVIEGFPMFVYSEVKEHKLGKGALECAVCLCEFEDYETLRLIPQCDHVFHPECIDEWLSGHVTCPVCRANLVPPSADFVKEEDVEIEIDEPVLLASEEVIRSGNEVVREEPSNLTTESESRKPIRRLGRSHSTGHSLVRPGECTERFTLRLPDDVRRQIMERPVTPYFPGRGFRSGDGSSRGRLLRRLDRLDRPAKSERWLFSKMPSFLTRVSSMVPPKSPKFANDKPSKSTANKDRSVKSGESAPADRPPI